MSDHHFDVVVVGAGLSGIAAGHHLKARCPDASWTILERREAIGGTWDLFRYPGIRSDSDMYTLGYSFKPWSDPKAIADGPSIRRYVRETAAEYGIDEHIRFKRHVKRASWSSEEGRWTVETEMADTGEVERYTCRFPFMCSGYYDYDGGYTPDFPGLEDFRGEVHHPQKWTPEIDHAGKRVVVIGSGATAVTLVPEMAKTATHVTMLQRSPTYVVSAPAEDRMANALRKYLPERVVYAIVRWRNVLGGAFFFWFCRRYPERAKRLLMRGVREQMGPDYDVRTHFNPKYDPWDQRVCLVPDADLFEAVKSERAEVVTDHIERFTETGIRLRSGRELEADMVVTATGLKLQLLGGMKLDIDGKETNPAESTTYKGIMFSDVPNLAVAFGYTNASWTLKCDLTCEWVCRLLNHMKAQGKDFCIPTLDATPSPEQPFLDFSSGYVQRSMDLFPKQRLDAPWKSYQNYLLDVWTVAYGSMDDGALRFYRARERRQSTEPQPTAGERAA